MKNRVNYEEFTNLNIDGNLTDFILYLRDRDAIEIAEHITLFSNVQREITKLHKDWLEVAKEEVKELNS